MKKIMFLWLILILMISSVLAQVPEYCGDGICQSNLGETEKSCEVDCRCIATVVELPGDEETKTVETELQIPFFDRGPSVDLAETCGYDGNLDGILCDPNENYLNCASDCTAPTLDSLLCFGPNCIWREAWFARILVFATVILGSVIFSQIKRRR